MRPLIGICSYLEEIRWGAWADRAAMVPAGYVGAIQRAGGIALVLPPDEATVDEPDALVDPATYGADPHPATDPPNELRDAFELALTRRALEREIPLLGICRGMQVLNVAAGGTLHQHLPDIVGHERHRERLGVPGDHEVRLADGSLAARAAGESRHATKSHHHQGVDVLGDGFVVTGWSLAGDDLPEAIEDAGRRFALGVQWHPEADERSRVIAALVEDARAARR
jgi:putative glutamine amidotransferase